MSRRKLKFFSYSKMVAPAIAAVGVVTLSTMNACSPSDRSTAAHEEVIAQNALDAEHAEEQMAKDGEKSAQPAAHDAHAEKGAHKTASHGEKTDKKAGHKPAAKDEHKTAAAAKQPKADKHGDTHATEHKTAKVDSTRKNEATPAAHLAQKELGHGPAKVAQADAHGTAAHGDGHDKDTHGSARRPASVVGGAYVVQVGAFRIKENAEKLQSKLKEAGYKAEMQTVEHSKNGLLHLVRFEATTNKAEAETMVEDLHAKHELTAVILTH